MKKHLKLIAVGMIALGVSGVVDTAAYALSKSDAASLRSSLKAAITEMVIGIELKMDAIDALLMKPNLSDEDRRDLLAERRSLFTEYSRLKSRRMRMDSWTSYQVAYWANVYMPTSVSPT